MSNEELKTDSPEQQVQKAKVMIDDAIVTRIYELQRIAESAMTQRQLDKARAEALVREQIDKYRTQTSVYRREVRRVNKAQRVLKLEYEALKRRYDELIRRSSIDGDEAFAKGYKRGYRDATPKSSVDEIPF